MNLETEIIEAIQQTIEPNFSLSNSPISFYSKNRKQWIKITMIHQSGIRYTYHGFLNEQEQIQSRECHSERHHEVSNRISEALNQNRLGKIIKRQA